VGADKTLREEIRQIKWFDYVEEYKAVRSGDGKKITVPYRSYGKIKKGEIDIEGKINAPDESCYIYTDDTVMAHIVFDQLLKNYQNPENAINGIVKGFVALFDDKTMYIIDPLHDARGHGNTSPRSCREIKEVGHGSKQGYNS
jgi:hypothetical protein